MVVTSAQGIRPAGAASGPLSGFETHAVVDHFGHESGHICGMALPVVRCRFFDCRGGSKIYGSAGSDKVEYHIRGARFHSWGDSVPSVCDSMIEFVTMWSNKDAR